MLASDLIMSVRASRGISAEDVEQLERMLFAGGTPSSEQLDLLTQIDGYVEHACPHWAALLMRAAQARAGRVDEHAKAA